VRGGVEEMSLGRGATVEGIGLQQGTPATESHGVVSQGKFRGAAPGSRVDSGNQPGFALCILAANVLSH